MSRSASLNAPRTIARGLTSPRSRTNQLPSTGGRCATGYHSMTIVISRHRVKQCFKLVCLSGCSMARPMGRDGNAAAAHFFDLRVIESQSSPSNRPSPLMAEVLKMDHARVLMLLSPRPSATSAWLKAPGRSCLLA
ncbi:hypothetical protein F751_6558 [Auxenochlorella protothecoides]|uniref:Uncharacterized protein n=1 Tax=Auxenochlorella protothecoides TaxID=3075 RepID=A0A087STI5_AUXPR|nr:hypothetical protein F751_6558 [Auxenochlorella protothecoides]KFM29039.1 hypothetical protein F751_6558 [Auxenochlorella protothecoides]